MSGDGALTLVLKKLTDVLTEYAELKAGARYELQQLQSELGLMRAFLRDSAGNGDRTAVFKEMEGQIREIAYDVEDTIDDYLTKKALAKTKNIVLRYWSKLGAQTEKEVKSLREKEVRRIVDAITIRDNFGVIERPLNEIIRDEPSVHVYTPDQQPRKHEKVVDFEDEATVMQYVMESKEDLDIIAITGMPGVGKTTFIRKIFEHKSVISKFELRIWVGVSEKFNCEDALAETLKQIAPARIKRIPTSYPELKDIVHDCLENVSFLLVIDNVWTIEDWDKIEPCLPKGNGKGKVLVTTRMKAVAEQANIWRKTHELKGLGEDQSLELLKLKVFGSLQDCPSELENIGEAIVEKCGGVPLTILVIGGILKGYSMTQPIPKLEEQWLQVCEKVDAILRMDREKEISNAIGLSYKRLSDDLRLCFLYMGLFPENQEIPTSTLTQLWIAEGFIRKIDGESLERTAEGIMDTLINMSLLMVVKRSPDRVKTCWVHGMIREFCRAKAMDENLFREIKKQNGEADLPVSEVLKFRRLCLNSNPTEFLSESWTGPRFRSFLCFSQENVNLDSTHISTISESFNKLRVLNCSNSINFQQLPEFRGLLKHITLSIGNHNVVPEQISLLINLQTLIVLTKSSSITVEANIWEMIQLRRFKTKASIVVDDKHRKAGSSKTLQTISRLSCNSCKDLHHRAPNLKVLAIRGRLAYLFQTLHMKNLAELEKLTLVNDVDQSNQSYHLLLTVQDRFPPRLKSLNLSNTSLEWNVHMPILAKIITLKVLKLKDNAFTGINWKATVGGFRELQFLLIENTNLVIWEASTDECFPSLTWLVVKNCKELLEIPKYLGGYLEKLEIEDVKKSVADSAKEIESNQNQRLRVPFKLTIGPECGS